MAGHNLRKTYPPPPHSVLWISLWSTLELPIWYIVCFLYIMFLPFEICKKHVSILIRQSVQDKMIRRTTKMLAAMPDMTIIILTIVAMSRNFTTILTMIRLEDLTVTETERPRRPPQRGNLGETRAALAPECTTIVITLVLSKLSSAALAGSALSTLSSPWSSSLDVGKAVFAPGNSHLADRSTRWADVINDHQSTSWLL